MFGVLSWLSARRVAVALALLGAVLGAIALAKGFTVRAWDARVYRLAAERFWLGEALYRESDGHMPFKYAPPAALLFVPFALVPERLGLMAWGALSALGWAHAASRWTRLLGVERVAPVVVASVALFGSFFLEVSLGQVDLAMFWLLTHALWAARKKESCVWAGVAFAVACALKPPALLVALALGLVTPSRARLGLGALGTVALGLGALWARYGFDGGVEQLVAWRATLATTTPPWFLGHNSQSLVALVHLGLGGGTPESMTAVLPAQLLATLPFAALAWPLRHRPRLLAACLFVGVALLSPLAWRANFVLAWPAFLVLAARLSPVPMLYFGALVNLELLLTDRVLSEAARDELLLSRELGWLMAAGVALVLWETRSASPATASAEGPSRAGAASSSAPAPARR